MTAVSLTLADIARDLGGELRGDGGLVIRGLHTLGAAGPDQLSFLSNPRYKSALRATRAGAVLLRPEDAPDFAGNAVLLSNPYAGYARLAARFDRTPRPAAGIHPTAVVAADAVVAPSAAIGPRVVIGEGVEIGPGTTVEAGAVVQARTRIGRDCRIRANAVVYHDCVIGNRVNIHSGAVIGGDGFGFANDRGRWHKIAQIGRVVIHDDVDIGANTTVDRGALDDTVIHEGVIIDNLVQIAHNVVVGAHTAIAACCGISGSTRIGAHCVLAGGVGLVGHIEIADKVQITGMTMVTKSITEPGSYSSGTAFEPSDRWKKTAVRLRQLDDMARRLRQLEQELETLRQSGQAPD
ncbi:MAG TPA: UDP-3-O-(3-hydroxymyristoyl)glucosamine N-acyltransferase [Moraxellaceae bacterium]|nr:UDP-3-O-(3-hydroxymyristoyl)glucosamine N-acyltransferase [Moraxellaceae bacterium]